MEAKTVQYGTAGGNAEQARWHLVISAINETNRLLAAIGTLLENAAEQPTGDEQGHKWHHPLLNPIRVHWWRRLMEWIRR